MDTHRQTIDTFSAHRRKALGSGSRSTLGSGPEKQAMINYLLDFPEDFQDAESLIQLLTESGVGSLSNSKKE